MQAGRFDKGSSGHLLLPLRQQAGSREVGTTVAKDPNKGPPTVARMIREAMRRKGYNQQRLAREARTTSPWINMIVRRGKAPGAKMLLKIADVLGMDRRKLVRQAHRERAYVQWEPYLGPPDRDDPEREKRGSIPVIGTARAGGAALSVSGKAGTGPRGSRVGFNPDCMAIRVSGDRLEPVAYDGQYVVISPLVRKERIPDGSIVYVTYELPGDSSPRAMIRRMYRYHLAGDREGESGLPVYVFMPVNAHLRYKGRSPEPQEAVTLRHRQVMEMHPVVGVIFGDTAS